ncbi:hypothetical protein CAI21_18160 [Alkalilimnicola ehrlichii]|uniref:Restriction endonuclease subunit S n=1 Tax=Alkalilimnicola ehrlichii TaxID=351052 RepID=A0A3E0WT13_9GAMM|nr:restriction endonuclease subunit S [Alkalilimnicola ehrlichii]RFA25784.1 hypothetical protein CAI21_18160 [Alkalilimnicola ehrlichii]RFA35116.1 hypothetical protein CAL65_13490 [Alkalilimnicola ehrlichii]
MSFPRYPEYKDSGVEWLGEVPAHWRVVPCRTFVEERKDKNSDAAVDAYLSLMANVGVIPYEEKGDVGNKKPDDLSKCKIVKRGDLVINSMNYGIGSYGLSGLDGVCSPVYIVLRAVEPEVLPRYALRIFENRAFQSLAQSFGNGILAHRAAIGWDDLKGIKVALPPKDEQNLLAAFLDHETAKIDALVDEQKRLIEFLKEKRQAVISHAVTKGLDPNVPMKDSGVEWLGEVPAHWVVLPIKYVIKSMGQGWSPQCENRVAGNDEFGVLKVGCVNGGQFKPEENKALPSDLAPDPNLSIRTGDLMISRANTRDLVGSAAVALADYSNLLLCDKLYRLRLDDSRCLPRFLSCYLGTRMARGRLELEATGASSSMLNIGQATVRDLVFPVPPVDEQHGIVTFIDNQLVRSDKLVAEAEKAVELLQERRSALISAAVTGKIDVRGWKPASSVATDDTAAQVTA